MIFFQIILLIVLICFSIYLESILEKEHYKTGAPSIGLGKYFFVPIFYPKPFFKRENFWEGYVLYIARNLSFISTIYTITHILGLT